MSKRKETSIECPCCSGKCYAECCHLIHQGALAKTAECLMRSRYSAYALGLDDYILHSWHLSTRPSNLALDDMTQWIGLKIKNTEQGLLGDKKGMVEFVARYKVNGKASRLTEASDFVFEDGRWFYLSGKQ